MMAKVARLRYHPAALAMNVNDVSSEFGAPGSGSPDPGSPDPGSSDPGSSGSGSSGSGSPDSGSPDSGSPDSGSSDPGSFRQAACLAQDWQAESLPLTWPDRPGAILRLWWGLLTAPFERGKRQAEVPGDLPGTDIPMYAREQFHGLPNGYYSHNIADGYDKGFEASMLYRVGRARRRMANKMGSGRALDVGCGSGRLTSELLRCGAAEVWGLDPSPYMLKIAQARSPRGQFVQGLIEDNHFPDEFFDSAGACFVFHELPKVVAQQAIVELYRILKPGAILCITEPCREHIYERNPLLLLRKYGLKGLYFHLLAKGVYEPYLEDWQSLGNHKDWLFASGFEVEEQVVEVPFQFLVARKVARPRLMS